MSQKTLPKIPFPFTSIKNFLEYQAAKFNSKLAIIGINPDTEQNQNISYSDLYRLTLSATALLLKNNIKYGDCFAILFENSPEILILELAGALIGATCVPLDSKRDTLERKLYKLRDTNSKALFTNLNGKDQIEIKLIQKENPNLSLIQWASWQEFIKILPTIKTNISLDTPLTNPYLILYTSGTTALPKGVVLSTKACVLNAMGIIDWQKFDSNDIFNIVLPLHHINSTEFCLSMLISGGTIILNSRYSASNFWKTISKYRATNTSIVPTILHDLLIRFDEFKNDSLDITSLKRICIGSAPVLPEETLRFYKTFGVRVVQGYGQTETALRVAGVPINIPESDYVNFIKINTFGSELANNQIKIMDEKNNEKQENEHGEICINGPILASEYLNNSSETKKAFKNGWFHSGDLGFWKNINGRKLFFIIGRLKEIIIKGGINISPAATEDALLKTFPKINEVSVVGFADERYGEEIAAVITLHKQLDKLAKNNLIQKILKLGMNNKILGISSYESPKKIFFVETLPKTSTGKIQRVEIKKMIQSLIKNEIISNYFVRKINPNENEIIKKAVQINNERWIGLPSNIKEFTARAKNAILWGIFKDKEGIIGSLSCVQINRAEINNLTSWNQVTDNGMLSNNNLKGNALMCVSISVKGSQTKFINNKNQDYQALTNLAPKKINEYLKSKTDHVLNFHNKPKGGLPGAKIWKILANSRPADRESMGYNIIMKYPNISKNTKIIHTDNTPSVMLIEHALLYAKQKNIKNVFAFSRPAGFKQYLLDLQKEKRSKF